jgi:phytoene synthase
MMANIYRTLLRDIERQGFRVLHQRTSITPIRKLWIATRTHLTGR